MNNIKFYFIIFSTIILFSSCARNKKNANISPEKNNPSKNIIEESKTKENSINNIPQNIATVNKTFEDNSIDKNMPAIIEDLRRDLKKIQAELDYQNKNLNKLEAQSQVWANPFSIYNKEIVLNNGSSVFGKIIYQDQDVMKVETLIGQLIIDRNTITRVVNQVSAYGNFDQSNVDFNNITENELAQDGINLIQKRIKSLSAHLVLIGDITEEKDVSGNTILSGEVKNMGNKRADFSKIIFTFRTNWHGDTKTLTTFIDGITNTFETGISSDNSILPHAVGKFELIIPYSFGTFIGYSYEIDWSQYDG